VGAAAEDTPELVAAAVGLAGPGAYALDSLLPVSPAGIGAGLTAAGVGIAGGTLTVLVRRAGASTSSPTA
jgi:hypothetical protein